MGRLFTFGCSFTGYAYPTWADILIEEIESRGGSGSNWGKSGAGNLYIAQSIWEANAKYKFTPSDSIAVCWSGFNREDRYVVGRGWLTPGNLGFQNIYDESFLEKFADVRFSAMRDCMLMYSTRLALTSLGVEQVHFSMAPVLQNDEYLAFQTFPDQTDIIETYDLKFDAPPMMEFIGTLDQRAERGKDRPKSFWTGHATTIEWHPTPAEHLRYVETHITDKLTWLGDLSVNTKQFAHEWQQKLDDYKNNPIPLDKLNWQPKNPYTRW